MGKYLSPKDLSAARHEQEVWNSMLNRGLIDPSKFVRTHYVVCGCGAAGCGFVSQWMKGSRVIDLAEQRELYERWLEAHSDQKD